MYDHVTLVADDTLVDCQNPQLITHENETYVFWMEANQTRCYSNRSGTVQVVTIFEEDGLDCYHILAFEGKIVVCFSVYTETQFLIKYRVLDLASGAWNEVALAFTDSYIMKLGQGLLRLMMDEVTTKLYLAWTYCRTYDGRERSCLATWNGVNGFVNVITVSEALFQYHGTHADRCFFNGSYYYVVTVVESLKYKDYLICWTADNGTSLVTSHFSNAFKFLFLNINFTPFLFRIHTSFVEKTRLDTNFQLQFNTTGLSISNTHATIAVNSSGHFMLGYSKTDMGNREVYLSEFLPNGTLMTTKCISSPLAPYRESTIIVQQELAISARGTGLVAWVDRTNLTGAYQYNVFVSEGVFAEVVNPINQLFPFPEISAWWLIPALIGGLLLYLYFKKKK